jgi:sarcosine oxidase subunit alpha
MIEPAGEHATVIVNGRPVTVPAGATVAAAIARAGVGFTRRSVRGEARAPLCGMGVCYECRARVDQVAHRRTCMLACRPGMRIETDA